MSNRSVTLFALQLLSTCSTRASCSSSAVGSDTQSHGGGSDGSADGGHNKTCSPAPSTRHSEDTTSILKAPSEVASGVSTLAGLYKIMSADKFKVTYIIII